MEGKPKKLKVKQILKFEAKSLGITYKDMQAQDLSKLLNILRTDNANQEIYSCVLVFLCEVIQWPKGFAGLAYTLRNLPRARASAAERIMVELQTSPGDLLSLLRQCRYSKCQRWFVPSRANKLDCDPKHAKAYWEEQHSTKRAEKKKKDRKIKADKKREEARKANVTEGVSNGATDSE